MRISIFRGGYTTTLSNEVISDWDEFVDKCAKPEIGPKNGDYFVRGFCAGHRSDAGMVEINFIIIDGDQSLEDPHSCVPPGKVHAVLKELDITHCIYSSYSNDVINNRHKWRLIVPSDDITDAEMLAQGVAEIISVLQAHDLPVKNVPENMVISQPWFFPRCTADNIDDFYCTWHDGKWYPLGAWRVSEKALITYTATTTTATASFSWEYVLNQFARGTIHQGMKAAAGWLTRTTDWADKQIADHLLALVSTICPDKTKVARAKDGEALALVRYCRRKSGLIVNGVDISWRAHCITAAELKQKDFPPVRWAVDGIIPEGLTILAGDPKAGKSLMAVDICASIASGGKAFGSRSCVQGGAIYVSLEDPERRVKDRITRQCDEWPDAFRLVTGGVVSPVLPMLEEMLLIYPDTRCIVIDTLQYIVPAKPNNIPEYNHYYSVLDPLHALALESHVAIICITHKRKDAIVNGDNPFASIMGSAAISGTADSMMMLAKNHAKGKIIDPTIPDGFLHIIGRELGADCLTLEFDSERMVWTISNEVVAKVEGNANWLLITKALQISPLTGKGIAEKTAMNPSTVRSCLSRMAKADVVVNQNGIWQLKGRDYSVAGQSSGW